MISSAGCSLLRAEGFSCSFEVALFEAPDGPHPAWIAVLLTPNLTYPNVKSSQTHVQNHPWTWGHNITKIMFVVLS
jgi:hypothetical protein